MTSKRSDWTTVMHGDLIVPIAPHENFIAYDVNGKLWAYAVAPRWSAASRKWIPQPGDTPRLIVALIDTRVNPFLTIIDADSI